MPNLAVLLEDVLSEHPDVAPPALVKDPRLIDFRDELPLSGTGRTLKTALRDSDRPSEVTS
ncbi:hypothetical protein [Streptomyces fractus]|uniref:hypothetical protein n=1 Tax=Streptomyces fractus TaxID=641806 RepID=UPI003CF2F481